MKKSLFLKDAREELDAAALSVMTYIALPYQLSAHIACVEIMKTENILMTTSC